MARENGSTRFQILESLEDDMVIQVDQETSTFNRNQPKPASLGLPKDVGFLNPTLNQTTKGKEVLTHQDTDEHCNSEVAIAVSS